MQYTSEYRNQVLKKLLRPGGPTIQEVSDDTGVTRTTLYKWMRDTKNGQMSKKHRNPRKWSLQEKQAALREAYGKSEAELGKWLREKGLHSDHLKLWEKEIDAALAGVGKSQEKELKREIKKLNSEINRKDKALAEMSALIVLKKKFLALLGEQEDSEK